MAEIFMRMETLKEYWEYRELLYFLAWRDIKVRYKQTLLGASWAIIQPFFTMLVFTLFFGKLAKIPSDGIPYPIFSYCALVPWTFFSTAVLNAGNSIVSNRALITKIYFPRAIIPVSSVLSGLVDFGVASVILVAMMKYYQIQLGWEILLLPVSLIPLVWLSVGLGLIVSALNVQYRDVKYAIPFLIQLGLFATPIIYPTSFIPDQLRVFIALNPLTGIIETCRSVLLPTHQVDWNLFCVSSSISFVVMIVGLVYFLRTERTMADTI